MQPFSPSNSARIARFLSALTTATALAGSGGCSSGRTTVSTTPAQKPYTGITLAVSCPDPGVSAVIGPMTRSWAGRTGATVTSSADPRADIIILRPFAFGQAAANGEIQPLPKSVREAGHPFQISAIPDVYSEGVAGWAGQPFGVVLSAEGAVLVYRKDRFDDSTTRTAFKTRANRDLAPPNSWDDAAIIAEFFRERDGKPSLGPLPSNPAKLLDLFHRVAACTDRPAITPSRTAGRKLNQQAFAAEAVSFHFRFDTGTPRLTSPGFALAAAELAKLQPFRAEGTSDDPVEDLEKGAIFAVLTMADLARLPKGADGAVLSKYGVSRLPGSTRYYDALAKAVVPVSGAEANYVPYYTGGLIGCVSANTKHAEAAFDLLVELGGPNGTSAIVGEPACGSGPWRPHLIEPSRRNVWYSYGFSAAETDALLRAVKPYVMTDLRNPVVAPRGPGMEKLFAALEPHVRAAITGKAKPEDAMAAAQAEWSTLDRAAGPDVVKWRKADMRGE
jgi:ABC-type glycerol-3-phosphate transport system substrate-binding protein